MSFGYQMILSVTLMVLAICVGFFFEDGPWNNVCNTLTIVGWIWMLLAAMAHDKEEKNV